MAAATRTNAILAIVLAALVTSGSWVAYSRLSDRAEIICGESQELVDGECVVADDSDDPLGGESGTHSQLDCTASEVWRDEECQPMLAPSNLSYGDNDLNFLSGQELHGGISPSFSGDAVDLWMANPSLPEGMTLDNASGEIFGRPVGEMMPQNYTIIASNYAGSTTVNLTISSQPQPPIFQLEDPSIMLILGVEVDLEPPGFQSGSVDTWSAEPPLPAGLTLGTDGGIDGTPLEMGTTTHSIRGENWGGAWTQNLSITIVEQSPSGAFYQGNPFVFRLGNEVDLMPMIASGGNPTSWAISPALPEGLVFNTSTGQISGIPTVLYEETIHVVWANNSGGSNISALTLTVIDNRPKVLDYAGNYLDLALLVEQVNLTPTHSGGQPTSWEIHPALPNGLMFNTTTGAITGAASELWEWTNHTVWANNTGGVGVTTIHVRVVDLTPTNISWNATMFTLEANVSVILNANNLGPSIDTWE
nr:Ig domain-containing protein [Candidatus Poseidoniales archaeon]